MGGGKHKYRAVRTVCSAGHSHPSKAEAKRCGELRLLEQLGEIARLEQQPRFPCKINGTLICTYVADFAYFDNERRVIEDVKGQPTPVYKLKKKLVEALFPGTVIVEVRA
jgi:hypothetical protein